MAYQIAVPDENGIKSAKVLREKGYKNKQEDWGKKIVTVSGKCRCNCNNQRHVKRKVVRDYEEDCEKKREREKEIYKAVIGRALFLSVDYSMPLYAGCGCGSCGYTVMGLRC